MYNFSNYHQLNTRIELATLGTVELKYVSVGDITAFSNVFASVEACRVITVTILQHQLLQPKISVSELMQTPDIELELLAKAFIKNENTLFKNYVATGDIFEDFVNALRLQHKLEHEQNLEAARSYIDLAQKSIAAFDSRYRSVIGESLRHAAQVGRQLRANLDVAAISQATASLKAAAPMINQYKNFAKTLNSSLLPQIKIWSEWARREDLLTNTAKVWTEFQARYKIAQKDAEAVLRKYKWFISPSVPTPLIFEVQQLSTNTGRQDKAVNELFINYFEANEWQALETMVAGWDKSPYLKSRYKILVDCVQLVKAGSKTKANIANVVLPTLIVQIDGILYDYMKAKGLGHPGYRSRNVVLKSNPLPVTLPTGLDDVALEVFLNILFQSSDHGIPLANPFNFNRHKILHAENKAYGRKDYLVRAFMTLDLLAGLK